MSGGVKSGLLFAIIGLVIVIAVGFIPILGAFLCGPVVAAIVGGVAGYLGVRWSTANVGIGTGVLAGTLAGLGMLIGMMIFFTVYFSLIRSSPEFDQQLQEALRQRPDAQVTPAQIKALVGLAGPIGGFCLGLIYLLVSLAIGALGGWIAVRNRSSVPSYQPQPPQPPMGPPPMSPTE